MQMFAQVHSVAALQPRGRLDQQMLDGILLRAKVAVEADGQTSQPRQFGPQTFVLSGQQIVLQLLKLLFQLIDHLGDVLLDLLHQKADKAAAGCRSLALPKTLPGFIEGHHGPPVGTDYQLPVQPQPHSHHVLGSCTGVEVDPAQFENEAGLEQQRAGTGALLQ